MSVRTILACLACVALAACATAPVPYHPRTASGGYVEQELEPGLWQVRFLGASYSARQPVSQAMLLRAAEIALDSGSSHFEVLVQDEEETFERVAPAPVYGLCPPGWRPGRRIDGWSGALGLQGCGWGWPYGPYEVAGRFETTGIIRLLDAHQAEAIVAAPRTTGARPRLVFDAARTIEALRPILTAPQ